MGKRFGICFLFLAVAVVVLLSWWLYLPNHRINHESFSLIKKGMTEEEVQCILGVAPGDYAKPVPGPPCPYDDLEWADGGWYESSEVYWAMRTGGKDATGVPIFTASPCILIAREKCLPRTLANVIGRSWLPMADGTFMTLL
jgi:hypothetical protein